MAITVVQARALCTPSELQLVRMSLPREVVKLDARQLTAKIQRSRDLRDKWRDLTKRQTRTTKVKAPAKLDKANQRTTDKAQLFAETLARYEHQWQKIRSDSPQRASAKNPKTAKEASTPKSQRSAGHRATRSAVRGKMSETMAELNTATARSSAKSPAKKKKKVATKLDVPATETPTTKAAKIVKPAATASVRKKPAAPARKTPMEGLIPSEKERDLQARTAAKKTRFVKGGQVKIRAHIKSQQKRNQARRDSR